MKYGVKEWGDVQGVQPLIGCLENKETFECHPEVEEFMMKTIHVRKLLIVSPHFSTGGAPQVTLNKVELLKDHFDIMVIEYSFLAWNFVVQRNKVIDILGKNFISLGEDKLSGIKDVVEGFQP